MNIVRDSLSRAAALLGGLLLAGFAGEAALAADASPWSRDVQSAARLIAAGAPRDVRELRAGVEIKLEPGWHTYWRYPGDSGVPPRFDFAGSENLRTAKVSYPAPLTFHDETGTSIGYKDHVVFPLRIMPRDPGKPVRLKLSLDYAVCEKMCVPAQGAAEITLDGTPGLYDEAVAAAEARVPKPVPLLEAGLSARRVNSGLKPLVFVDVVVPDGKNVQIFAEGPTAEWALPIPKPAPGAPKGHRHFGFELDGLPPGVNPMGPLQLTFTIVGDGAPIETTTHLD